MSGASGGGGGGGASPLPIAADWAHIIPDAELLAPLVGDYLPMNTLKAGSGVTVDGGGLFTLKAGNYAAIWSVGASFSSGAGSVAARLYDVTNAAEKGARAYSVPPTFPSSITRGPLGGGFAAFTVASGGAQFALEVSTSVSVTKTYGEVSGTRLMIIEISQGGAVPDRENAIFVGKHGADTNDGLTPDKAKLTFGAAIAVAVALTPSASNRFALVCVDAGDYAENVAVPSWCGVYAPNAKITGNHTVTDNSLIHSFRLIASSGVAVTKLIGGTGDAVVVCPRMILTGSAGGVVCLSGAMNYTGESIELVNGFGIGNLSTDAIHASVDLIYITGTGIGIGISSSGELEYTGTEIRDDGAGVGILVASTGVVNASLARLDCATAYNVSAAGASLRLVAARMSGTQASVGSVRYLSTDGGIDINGPVCMLLTSVAADYAMTNSNYAVSASGSAAAVEITLPTSPRHGQIVKLKAVDITNAVTIASVAIDGVTGVYTFASKDDSLILAWNNDRSTWEIY